jgi:murein DD-endopeptidase MepM/ murein hydrolase activator NlpD
MPEVVWENRGMSRHSIVAVRALFVSLAALGSGPPAPTRTPLVRALDLDIGESATIKLCDGTTVHVKLLAVDEARDSIRAAVRQARVTVVVNGEEVALTSATYHLPMTVAGVQVDCPVTRGHMTNTTLDHWGLVKAARLRFWPARSPWVEPGTFIYPVLQRWFASATQMANEPSFVDEFERPSVRKIYYHSGLDIGGAEGLVDVVAAAAGLVVSTGTTALPGYKDTPVAPRYDVVYVLDEGGWYYRYSHLHTIDQAIKPGAKVAIGQKIGLLGKEGASGGWSHLHFEIVSRQPSGRWGTEEGYAFLWEAAIRRDQPAVVALARPHHLAWTGEPVLLDGSGSWCRTAVIARHDWTFHDGTTASGPMVERIYTQPGEYCEVLKVTDEARNAAYDFAIVQVLNRRMPEPAPPTIHAAYAPTQGLRPGNPVTFKVRTFGTTDGSEQWNFGDGSPPEEVRSDGNVQPLAKDGYASIVHRFARPGDYLVRVERADRHGRKAVARLAVQINPVK